MPALDCALCLPQEWLDDPTRCGRAGIPAGTTHHTKPQLALDAGVPAARVVADVVWGSDRTLRRVLEARVQAYVLAVRGHEESSTWSPEPKDSLPGPREEPLPAHPRRV